MRRLAVERLADIGAYALKLGKNSEIASKVRMARFTRDDAELRSGDSVAAGADDQASHFQGTDGGEDAGDG